VKLNRIAKALMNSPFRAAQVLEVGSSFVTRFFGDIASGLPTGASRPVRTLWRSE